MSGTACLAAVAGWLALYELRRHRLERRGVLRAGVRRWRWYAAGGLLAVVGLPPLAVLAQQHLWAQTLQFCLLAFGVAPLAATGLPRAVWPLRRPPAWRAIRTPTADGLAALGCFLAATIGWRVPGAVDAVASGRGWLAVEAVTVIGGTWWLWVVLAGGWRPELDPPRPLRVALGAVATWSVWIFAYVLGFSHHVFYPAFGGGRTPTAAQVVAVALLLGASLVALCPFLFVNLVRWLSADQAEAEAEMSRYRPRQPAAHGGGRG